jgi:hypothetical protein
MLNLPKIKIVHSLTKFQILFRLKTNQGDFMKNVLMLFLLFFAAKSFAAEAPVSYLLRSTLNSGTYFGHDYYNQPCSIIINSNPNQFYLDFASAIKDGYGNYTSTYFLKDRYPRPGRNDCPQIIAHGPNFLQVRNVPTLCQANPIAVHPGEIIITRRGPWVQIIMNNPRFPAPSACIVGAGILRNPY